MGARVARMFRNFNLENRVHREIAKSKPRLAPRHARTAPETARASEETNPFQQKEEPLLKLLQSVYVESKDPQTAQASEKVELAMDTERRPAKFSLPGDVYGVTVVTDVPKGKLTVAEALKALAAHRHQPQAWTPEKIAEEYSLDLKDTKALLEFFVPFEVQVIQPTTKKQIKAS